MDILRRFREGRKKPNIESLTPETEVTVTIITVLIFMFGIGAPIWYFTTRLYRAELPGSDITRLEKNFIIELPFRVGIYSDESENTSKDFGASFSKIDQVLKDSIESKTGKLHIRDSNDVNNPVVKFKPIIASHVGRSDVSISEVLEKRQSAGTDAEVAVVLREAKNENDKAFNVIVESTGLIKVDFDNSKLTPSVDTLKSLTDVLSDFFKGVMVQQLKGIRDSVYSRPKSLKNKANNGINWEKQRAMKYSKKYLINISLMKETYDGTCLDWEIESAIKEYLEPFLNEISDLVEFKVTSQIQHFTELTNVQPVEQNNARHISASKLPNFINSAEWNFASTDTDLPSIQFVIYVASEKLGPLYLLSPNGKPSANNGFLLPQWGGVVIHNPVTKNKQDPEHKSSHNNQVMLDLKALEHIFEIFLTQLRQLLGTQENFELAQPHLKNSYAQITYPSNTKSSDTGGYAQVNYVGLDFWEHLFLKNKYTVENTASAISTLNALYRLTTSMTDMVIRDEIKEAVELSLQNLAVPNLEFINSVMAAQYANFAFFHDTMVSMLYFPTEHKYAMYLPYFLPITLPVLAAIANYIARRKQKHKKQSAVENQEEKLKSE